MKILIIGSGRMANALAPALSRAGNTVVGICSRNQSSGRSLAKHLHCNYYHELNNIPPADIIIIAVQDDITTQVAKALDESKAILVHTSGSVALAELGKNRKAGVFYPMETLTGKRNISFKRIPICVESTDEKTLQALLTLAKAISEEVYVLDSNTRMALHAAAVFTNNFTNHLLGVAYRISKSNGFAFEILKKLAATTIQNAFKSDPFNVQTGPAKRNDQKTIRKHLALLKNNPQAKKLYATLSESIAAVHNKPASKSKR